MDCSNIFHEFKCKSLRYMSSFFPDAITIWNNVITHFGDIPSLNVLKNHILSLIRPKKNAFLVYMILWDFGTSSN